MEAKTRYGKRGQDERERGEGCEEGREARKET